MRYIVIFYIVCAILVFQFDCNRRVKNAILSAPTVEYSQVEHSPSVKNENIRLAVLDFDPSPDAGITSAEVRFLSNRAREVVFNNGAYQVVTEENVFSLLAAHGRTLEECADTNCEIEFGTMVGADLVMTTRLNKFSDYIFVTMKMHDTASSSLVAASSFRSKDIADAHVEIEIHVNKMLRQIK
jgi:hypothetical protein